MRELAISATKFIYHHLPLTRYHRMVTAVSQGRYGSVERTPTELGQCYPLLSGSVYSPG